MQRSRLVNGLLTMVISVGVSSVLTWGCVKGYIFFYVQRAGGDATALSDDFGLAFDVLVLLVAGFIGFIIPVSFVVWRFLTKIRK